MTHNIDCPFCDAVNHSNVLTCRSCGYHFYNRRGYRRPSHHERLEGPASALRSGFKKLMILGFIALGGYLAYLGLVHIYNSMQPPHPHPTDPAETTRQFFTALSEENYQQCYSLLESKRKTAVVVGVQDRESGYNPHFERIREYLEHYAGDNFAEKSTVSEDGRQITFPNGITLHMQLSTSKSSFDKQEHFGIHEITEFPIDAAPGLGVEQYHRGINRMIDSMEGMADTGEVNNLSDVINSRPGESDRQRLDRMIESLYKARQLDIKHGILEWILKEFPYERATQNFLVKLSKDERQPAHLRAIAQNHIR